MKKTIYTAILSMVFLTTGCGESSEMFTPISNRVPVVISETEMHMTEVSQTIAVQPEEEHTEQMTEISDEPEQQNINAEDYDSFTEKLHVVGDSIASGYSAYERLPWNHVFAQQSANLSTITDIVFSSDYGDNYVIDIIAYAQPEYLMLSVGLNEIGNRDPQAFAEKYKGLADEFHSVSPDTKILIAGMTPICYGYENEYIDNQNISEHNYELSVTFTGEDNIWFVNPGTALQTDDGGLNPDYSGGDGIHLGGAAYDIMLEEIYSFVINSGI